MIPVKSSNIESVGYHEESGALHVVFKDGGHYIYHKVSPANFERFMTAPSKGAFLHRFIKKQHQHTKIT